MRQKVLAFLLCVWFMTSAQEGFCSVRHEKYTGNLVRIKVAVGKTTEVVFPELVALLLRSQVPGSIDLEVKDKSLYILPKSQSQADIFVRTVGNTEVPVGIIFSENPDERVYVNYEPEGHAKGINEKPLSNLAVGLIRAMVRGEDIPGATRYDLNEVVLHNASFAATIKTRYELNDSVALIVEIENRLDRSIITPVQQVHLKNLLAITSDKDILGPKGRPDAKTLMYLVLRK